MNGAFGFGFYSVYSTLQFCQLQVLDTRKYKFQQLNQKFTIQRNYIVIQSEGYNEIML